MKTAVQSIAPAVARDGFAIVEDVISLELVRATLAAIETQSGNRDEPGTRQRRGSTYAIRNLLAAVPKVRDLAKSTELLSLVETVLGSKPLPTRAILFDKNPQANWAVTWHQDTTIAVQARIDQPGFGPWSVKAGVVHVQPPASVLEGMLTARIHLDDCDENNGALMVLPESHRVGMIDSQVIEQYRKQHESVTCPVCAGGVLFMRPLLLHASLAARSPMRRRVVHLEFAGAPLPNNLNWAEA